MQRFICALALSAAAAFSQSAETIPFRAVLLPSNEIPAVNIAASGTGTVWLHIVRDAQGRVVSASTDFDTSVRFPGAVQITGMHIHKGKAGENGPVTIDSGIRGSSAVAVPEGVARLRQQGYTDPSNAPGFDTVNGMLTDPSGFYLNVHTTDNPAGVIRGQLQRAQMTVLMAQMSPANEVPPITGSNALAMGSIVALMTRDSNGTITSGLVTFDANYSGFEEGTTFTGFHIHESPRGINGPVTINTGIGGGANSVAAVPSGGNLHYDVEVPMQSEAAVRTLAGLFSRPDQYYMNLHTAVSPAGIIRGQLRSTDVVRFPVVLSPANENPAISIDASGPSVFEAHTIRNSSGAVEGAVAIFDVNYRMPGATTFTGLHVHNGRAGENGPVTIDSGLNSRSPIVSESGNGNVYRIATMSSATALAALSSVVSTPENHYMNIHTSANPAGIMRSQLMPDRKTAPAITAVISAVSDPNLRRFAPGGLLTIFGTNLVRVMSDVGASSDGESVPSSFNGTTVKLGDASLPLVSIGDGYIVAQVPFESATGARKLIVTTPVGVSDAVDVQIDPTAPAIYFDAQGGIFSDLSFQLTGRAGVPAQKGDFVIVFSTGLGAVTAVSGPAASTGKFIPLGVYTPREVTVTVDGKPARVVATAASPGFVGLYQTVFAISADTRSGTVPVQIRSGEAISNTVNMLVQ